MINDLERSFCRLHSTYALFGYRYCPRCGETPVPSFGALAFWLVLYSILFAMGLVLALGVGQLLGLVVSSAAFAGIILFFLRYQRFKPRQVTDDTALFPLDSK